MGARSWRDGRCSPSWGTSRWSGLAVAALLHERVIAAQAHPTVITRNLPGIAPTAPLECACMATECRSPEDRERALSSIGSRHRDKIRRGANGASEQDVPPAREETQLACGPSGQPDSTHQCSCACQRSAKLAGTLHEVETNSLARPASAPVPVQCHAPANRRRNCRDLPAE